MNVAYPFILAATKNNSYWTQQRNKPTYGDKSCLSAERPNKGLKSQPRIQEREVIVAKSLVPLIVVTSGLRSKSSFAAQSV